MGKIFSLKFNRWFGMHNPLGSDLGKAGDPHLSMRKLAVLSYSGVLDVRYAVARNLADRLKLTQTPANLRLMTTGFNRSVVVEALRNVTRLDLNCQLFAKDFISRLKAVELSALLAGDPNKLLFEVAADAAANPSAPVNALLDLLKHPYLAKNDVTGKGIYPVRKIAANNLNDRVHTMNNETANLVHLGLQFAVLEETR